MIIFLVIQELSIFCPMKESDWQEIINSKIIYLLTLSFRCRDQEECGQLKLDSYFFQLYQQFSEDLILKFKFGFLRWIYFQLFWMNINILFIGKTSFTYILPALKNSLSTLFIKILMTKESNFFIGSQKIIEFRF